MSALASVSSTDDAVSELCVRSQASNLASIAEFVSGRARQSGMDENTVFDVQMAVDEACTNIIEHAYAGRGDGEVRICCYVRDADFVVSISDDGMPFDPDAVPEPRIGAPIEERDIGGLGLFFMRQLMDRVEFHAGALSGNMVEMTKAIRGRR